MTYKPTKKELEPFQQLPDGCYEIVKGNSKIRYYPQNDIIHICYDDGFIISQPVETKQQFSRLLNTFLYDPVLTEEDINRGIKEAYENIGNNAYFANGFRAGVKYAIGKLQSSNIDTVLLKR